MDTIYRSSIDFKFNITPQKRLLMNFVEQRLESYKQKINFVQEPIDLLSDNLFDETPEEKRINDFNKAQERKFKEIEDLIDRLSVLENEIVENCQILENCNDIDFQKSI